MKPALLSSGEKEILASHIPQAAADDAIKLLESMPVRLFIKGSRRTKLGDFRVRPDGSLQISVNGDLNPYHFLITLIHELAHASVYLQYGKRRIRPHGNEWKDEMRRLMQPFLTNTVFPNDILPYLAQYLVQPKAATTSDTALSAALKKYDPDDGKVCIFELNEGDAFILNGISYRLGKKLRTRHECERLDNGKKYLIHHHAEVQPLIDSASGK